MMQTDTSEQRFRELVTFIVPVNLHVSLGAVWRVLNSSEAASKCLDDEGDRSVLYRLITTAAQQ